MAARPTELEAAEQRMVAKLRLLMEHQSAALDSKTTGGKPGSKPPKGARPDLARDQWGGPFDPEVDPLINWYVWRRAKFIDLSLGEEDEHEARWRLLREADIRYDHRKSTEGRRKGVSPELADTSRKREARICNDYTGLAPEHVSLIESDSGYVSAANVIRVREAAGLDGKTGRPRDEVPMWSRAQKRDEAKRLRRIGLSVREIASQVDMPASTVQGWVKGISADPRSGAKAA
jgi:transposase